MQAHTPEEFQRRVDTALAGLPRVFAVNDDLIVRGKGNTNKAAPKDHDENIHPLPQGFWEKGNKPNEGKLGYKYAYTLCPGQVISKTNPKKTDVIKQLQQPKDKGEIHCLLCMVGYLQKCAPHMSEITAPLRQLWSWRKSNFSRDSDYTVQHWQQQEKNVRTTGFMVLWSESWENDTAVWHLGLGSCLMDSGQPIQGTTRALTETQQKRKRKKGRDTCSVDMLKWRLTTNR